MANAAVCLDPHSASHSEPRPLGRFDPFRRLSPRDKQLQLDGYRRFLRERDGELDFPGRVLPRREADMRAIESSGVAWRGETDRDAFYDHYYGVGRTSLDARTNWLLVISAFNVNEIYAVEGEIQRWMKRGLDGADPILYREGLVDVADAYAGGADKMLPLLSPVQSTWASR